MGDTFLNPDKWLGLQAGRESNRQEQKAQTATEQAQQYMSQALQGYQAQGITGKENQNLFMSNLSPLLSQLANATGVGAFPTISPGVGQRMGNTPAAMQMNNQGYAQQAGQQNPYQLTQAQHQQLGQQINTIRSQQQTAIASFTSDMQARGIRDPQALQAGISRLNQKYEDAVVKAQSDFAETARSQRVAGIDQIMGILGNVGQQGIGQQEFATSGTAALTNPALAQANAANQAHLQAQQQQNAIFSDLLGIGAYAATGGFAGAPNTGGSTPAYTGTPSMAGPYDPGFVAMPTVQQKFNPGGLTGY